MDKDSSSHSGTRIHIFVGAPGCEIDIPVMQLEGDVAHGVSQIETDQSALLVGRSGQVRDVKQLSGNKLDAWQEAESKGASGFSDGSDNVFVAKEVLSRPRLQFQQRLGGIQAMPLGLRFDDKLQNSN